jgi:biopolymer transport protein ExbD
MQLDRPLRKQKPISLTPLVDVIFLLLLFFMLSSTFSTFGQVEVGAPAGGGGNAVAPKAILVLQEGQIRMNGHLLPEEQLLDKARDLLERDIDSLLVLVRNETTTQQLVTVMTRLKSLPELKVTVAGN